MRSGSSAAGRPERGNVLTVRAGPHAVARLSAARKGGLRPMAVRVHVTHIPELDHLIALEYGRVDEGTPEESWRRVGRTMGYLYDASATAVGFKVIEAS